MTAARSIEPALQLALAWQPATSRPELRALFALDARLEGIVRRAGEPMLAQIRFAWWRERITQMRGGDKPGEPLLAELADTWGLNARHLSELVDGWEARLSEDSTALCDGRAAALRAFATLVGAESDADGAAEAGRNWARATTGTIAHESQEPSHLSRKLRGICVLDGLSRRAIARGEPMLAGRGAALIAWRLGLLGR